MMSASPVDQLIEYMRMLDMTKRTMYTKATLVHTLESFLLDHGRQWTPARRPRGLRKQPDKLCFMNSQRHVLTHQQLCGDDDLEALWYCEGFALGVIPIHHAWLVDRSGTVLDLTWDEPDKATYWGVAFNTSYLRTKVIETERWLSLLDNYEQGWPLLRGIDGVQEAVVKWRGL